MKKMFEVGLMLLFFLFLSVLIFRGWDSAPDIAKAKDFYSHKDLETSVSSDLSSPDAMRVMVVDTGREVFTIQTSGGEGKKPLKPFSHKKHQDIMECGECHHKIIDDGEPVPIKSTDPVERCEACHNEHMENPTWDDTKEFFHGKCRVCHQKGGGKVKGTCNECHIPKPKKMEGC